MSAALRLSKKLSVEEYLAQERDGEVRHEYVGGALWAMAGASDKHNVITGNIFAGLHAHLRGKPCKAFINDMKVRLYDKFTVFYYPDVMVACDPDDNDPYFRRRPKVIVEVLSDSTRDTDTREKLLVYINLPSVEEYVIVEQDCAKVTVHRRADQWEPEELTGLEAVLHLRSLDFTIPLSRVYEDVTLEPKE